MDCRPSNAVSIRSRRSGQEKGVILIPAPPVSIRSRRSGQEKAGVGDAPASHVRFQSAPGAVARRKRAIEWLARHTARVSIRSRRSGQEKASWPSSMRCDVCECFNPLPAQWPGESLAGDVDDARSISFNPLPAQWPGESATADGLWRISGFQSAPGAVARRKRSPSGWRPGSRGVSIRSRRSGQEKARAAESVARMVRFQSAPGAVARRKLRGRAGGQRWCGFNPLPAQWPGESGGAGARCVIRFNPLPAQWPGESSDPRRLGVESAVSIRSRRSGQEKGRGRRSERFNPLPAQWPGASRRAGRALFQSAPGAVARRKPPCPNHMSPNNLRPNPANRRSQADLRRRRSDKTRCKW